MSLSRRSAGAETAGNLRLCLLACGVVVLSSAALGFPGAANAAPSLETGFSDGLYASPDGSVRGKWLDETVGVGSEVVRLNLNWRNITAGEPANPRDPTDPAYDFSAFDAAISNASARGLDVLLTFYSMPNYAEGANRPGNVTPGTWKPKPGPVEDFAFALGSRYPQVDYIQAGNEPNLSAYLAPQFTGKKAKSPALYRDFLNAAYKGVRDAGDAQLVTAGTAPYGDSPGGDRMHPLDFWRKVFCLKGNCAKSKFDIFAHHPINTSGGPHRSAVHPDDASTPDFGKVVRILRKAEQMNNVAGGRHQAWATELWWESDPPDDVQGIPKNKHARYLEDALYVLWKQGARVVINLQIRDSEFTQQNRFQRNTTGIFYFSEEHKPAYRAWRFPFVTHRRSGKKVGAWGKAPAAGSLKIERRKEGDWRTLEQQNVAAGGVFTDRLKLSGAAKLRARVAGLTSLTWKQTG